MIFEELRDFRRVLRFSRFYYNSVSLFKFNGDSHPLKGGNESPFKGCKEGTHKGIKKSIYEGMKSVDTRGSIKRVHMRVHTKV